ncbi:putative transcription factor C2H2 family [Dioscorea sansibarensis]
MIWLLLLGLFLVCAGMSLVFSVYLCLLWLATIRNPPPSAPVPDGVAKAGTRGLSALELDQLAEAKDGSGLVAGSECAVCLEDIEAGQRARVLPSCRHSFHLACADAWLLAHPHCPLCRTTLIPASS